MTSVGEGRAGQTLDRILHSFTDCHLGENLEISGVNMGLIGISITVNPKISKAVRDFFEKLRDNLLAENLTNVDIKRTSVETVDTTRRETWHYIIYPTHGDYTRDDYRREALSLLRKIPKYMRDFRQRYSHP